MSVVDMRDYRDPGAPQAAARVPPQNLDIERAVLGAMMMYPDCLPIVTARIGAEHFADGLHSMVFDVLLKLAQGGRPVTPMAARTFLPDELGGRPAFEYLADLARDSAIPRAAAPYADMLADLHARRAVITAAEEAIEQAHNPPTDLLAPRLIEGAIDSLRAVSEAMPQAEQRETVDSAFNTLIGRARDRLDGKEPRVAVTGLADIDARLSGGLLPGRLIVLAGRPGMGKTVLATALQRRVAQKGGGVASANLEIDVEESAARLASNLLSTGSHAIDYRDILAGRLDEDQIERVAEAQREIRRLPLEIDERSGLSMAQIETRALQAGKRFAVDGRKLDVVVIDYLQLVKVTDRYKGKTVEELGEVALAAKNMAKRHGICVVLLSQLNRGVEHRESKRPALLDLRGSGNIEEHADAVGLIYRPAYYDRDDPKVLDGDEDAVARAARRAHDLEVIWAKNRLGPTGTDTLWCDVGRSQVDSMSRHSGDGR